VAATYVIIAGFIVSLGAALTGFWDWWKSIERPPEHRPDREGRAHAGLAHGQTGTRRLMVT
jgi:hypothetical protein